MTHQPRRCKKVGRNASVSTHFCACDRIWTVVLVTTCSVRGARVRGARRKREAAGRRTLNRPPVAAADAQRLQEPRVLLLRPPLALLGQRVRLARLLGAG